MRNSRSSNAAAAAGPLLIQELDSADDATVAANAEATAVRLSDGTLGLVVGVLLGMLCDDESYVYLGAVQALRTLLGMAGGAAIAS